MAGRLGLPQEGWTVAYQSASGPGQDWLGPSVDEVILELSERGIDQAVLCPFGFVADQVEILYDLDVVMKQKAGDLGVAVARTPLLNDGPALIDSLALLVERWNGMNALPREPVLIPGRASCSGRRPPPAISSAPTAVGPTWPNELSPDELSTREAESHDRRARRAGDAPSWCSPAESPC